MKNKIVELLSAQIESMSAEEINGLLEIPPKADMGDFAAFNEVYAKYFTSKPARSCVAVKQLPKGVLCEIEAIAEA